MSTRDDVSSLKPVGVADADWQDAVDIRDAFDRVQQGTIPEDEFRAFRLHRGIYGQRQPGVHMIRVKIPQGSMTAGQLNRTAEVARYYADGILHITTRQDIQIYFVAPERVPAAVIQLAEAGLTTRESSGSTVRNVTACPLAGLCATEQFDVTPYASAVSRYFLRHPLVQNLPRKVKIAFSGCSKDCAPAAINDIGLVAAPGERRGFRVVVGGGLGASPQVAWTLRDFVPADETISLIEAILRVFSQHGDRANRSKARLKFLIRRIGIETFRALVAAELEQSGSGPTIEATEPAPPPVSPRLPTDPEPAPGFDQWRAQNVTLQRQPGYAAVQVLVECGDIQVDKAQVIARVVEDLGAGLVRTTPSQNLVLPWIAEADLPAVHRALAGVGLATPYADTIADIVSCPGASTCRTGITYTKSFIAEMTEPLKARARDLAFQNCSIRLSGCPNSCGQHHIASIGLHGASVNYDGKKVPCYQVFIGGRATGDIRLGRPVGRVPARRIAQYIDRLVEIYQRDGRPNESFASFLERADPRQLATETEDLSAVRVGAGEEESLFRDLGQSESFSLKLADSECAA